MKQFLYIIIFTIFTCNAFAQEIINEAKPINTKDEAYLKAIAYTGFSINKDILINKSTTLEKSQQIIFLDSTTAFISKEINNKSAWKINFDTLYFESTGENSYKFAYSVDVYLEKTSGKLLSIECKPYEKNNRKEYRLPTAEETEAQIGHFGEKYHGLPNVDPKISFIEALDMVSSRFSAKTIYVSYLMYSYKDNPQVPAWIIYLRGIAPISNRGKEYQTTNFRYVINAMNGKLLWSNNFPYPLLEGGFGYDSTSKKIE